MSTSTVSSSAPPSPLTANVEQPTFGEAVSNYVTKVRGGDMGSLPALAALVVLIIAFIALRPSTFPSALNFANLFQQGAVISTISMGLVFVLLIGEIDLSAGFTSGLGGSIMAILLLNHGWPWYFAVVAAIVSGIVVGLWNGFLVAKVGIPSFIATLASFLALQGAVLLIISTGGNVPVHDNVILAIENKNLPVVWGWALGVIAVLAYAAGSLNTRVQRRRNGLLAAPIGLVVVKIVALAVVVLGAVALLSQERSHTALSIKGVPIVVPIIVVLALALGFVLTRTAFGRHIYAVGGNAEATRRAGIPVARVRMACFVLCSAMAAIAGIFAASRANSVDPNAGGSNTLLYAVGAAVIGGTSLFGGKGRIIDALIGGAVIAVIDNGMGLLGYSAGIKYIVTGAVLAAAAAVDALSRRRARATGRV